MPNTPIAIGKTEYALVVTPVSAVGLSYTQEELDKALKDSVTSVVLDNSGVANISTLLESVVDTDFERRQLKRVLESGDELESWRVGEGLAECYLSHHRDCCFPWPDSRDERKCTSSLPGADLVGFRGGSSQTIRFAFGEVKTSGENKYPPTAMYGRTGLKKQLEDLRDSVDIRDDLVKYLGYRASKASWKGDYVSASKRYLHDNKNVSLFGCLVRDVVPNSNDLSARVVKLSESCPTQMSIELVAIYLPRNSIKDLGKKLIGYRKGGSAS
jgi:hypothetical protein